ncbi:hypothetical protein RBU61_04725 [Tissierella sp. MB52-C2]|uniref:hypothetical protein n=1 Tax=Tissierella sp. MB52-C2 TaxID=3070999 RepID=UPI00280AAAEC|nr:hypothetical protein [Tissierella sp. MB52-C2]WMM25981.1 hypothetical protein RBU61_04725 [Tissierella sp. MB52-C2]
MTVNEKFIINLQGKSFVTYEGLLDLAHQRNLVSIEVEIVQIPTKENNMTAICKAIATTDKEKFQDIGDAAPNSVNSALVPHLIRMASTRAKARVLRDLTNVGMTAVEELSMEDSIIADGEENYPPSPDESPTPRQIETIKKLAGELNYQVNYDTLTKKTAGNIISRLIDEKKK